MLRIQSKKGFQMSDLCKGFYAGMPSNGQLEPKTPHCALNSSYFKDY